MCLAKERGEGERGKGRVAINLLKKPFFIQRISELVTRKKKAKRGRNPISLG